MKNLLPFLILIFSITVFGQRAYIISDNANFRKLPNADSDVLKELSLGTEITIISKKHLNGWYSATYKKQKGWLHGNTFSFKKADIYSLPPIEVPTYHLTGWLQIDESLGKNGGVFYYKVDSIKTDRLENRSGWVKTVPNNPRAFSKDRKLNGIAMYSLFFATVDCSEKRLSIESPVYYDSDENILTSRFFTSSTYRTPIVPGSIGESIWNVFCR